MRKLLLFLQKKKIKPNPSSGIWSYSLHTFEVRLGTIIVCVEILLYENNITLDKSVKPN